MKRSLLLSYFSTLCLLSISAFANPHSINSFQIQMNNQTSDSFIIQAPQLTKGEWISGEEAKTGDSYPAMSTANFGTESMEVNQGNGGNLYLIGPKGQVVISWDMPWQGSLTNQIYSSSPDYQVINKKLIPLSNNSHYLLSFDLVPRS
jgi:hypothetical protein